MTSVATNLGGEHCFTGAISCDFSLHTLSLFASVIKTNVVKYGPLLPHGCHTWHNCRKSAAHVVFSTNGPGQVEPMLSASPPVHSICHTNFPVYACVQRVYPEHRNVSSTFPAHMEVHTWGVGVFHCHHR